MKYCLNSIIQFYLILIMYILINFHIYFLILRYNLIYIYNYIYKNVPKSVFKKLKKDKCIFAESLSICEDDLN